MTIAEALSAAMVIVMFGIVLWGLSCSVAAVVMSARDAMKRRRIRRDADAWAQRFGRRTR